MAVRVEWTKRALQRLKDQLDFIELSSDNYKITFVNAIYHKIEQLEQHLEMGIKSKSKKTVRSILIDKNCRMYYRVIGHTISIVYFFDMRRNPDKNKYA